MEQIFQSDNGGRRSGLERRDFSIITKWESERRSGQERRVGAERRLQLRLASRTLRNLNQVKFESPSKISKLKK